MNNELIYQDATKLAEVISTKEVSPVEVLQAHLDRIVAVDPQVNAIVTTADSALAHVKAAEADVLAGKKLGPLHGVPFTVKDSIDTAGVATQRGSPIFKGRVPAPFIRGRRGADERRGRYPTIMHVASLLEQASSVRELRPNV